MKVLAVINIGEPPRQNVLVSQETALDWEVERQPEVGPSGQKWRHGVRLHKGILGKSRWRATYLCHQSYLGSNLPAALLLAG